jgi:DNA repair exonuclease SbcCD ATPase subunit
MKLLSLEVRHFRCVRKAKIEFGVGLNVLHGPNDLGKSSLAYAIRAALLLQASSKEHGEFVNWDGSGDPQVELVFESEPQRIWRVRKTFGSNAQAFLDESRNGTDFHVEARGRDVDGRLSEILRWGLAPPGGKGRPKGMPMTFLSTALLAEQDRVSAIFDQALANDSDESGKKRLVEALQAMAEDPLFKDVLGRVQDRVDEAFTPKGKKRLGQKSPWIQIRDLIRRAEEYERQCNQESQKTAALEIELRDLRAHQLECKEAVERAQGLLNQIEESHQRGTLRQEITVRLEQGKARLTAITKILEELATAERHHSDCIQHVAHVVGREQSVKTALTHANKQAQAANEEVVRLQSEDRARERLLKQSSLEKRQAELRTEQVQTKASLDQIRSVEAALETVRTLEAEVQQLTSTVEDIGNRHEAAIETVRRAEEQEHALRAVGHLLRCRVARESVKQATNGLAQINAWHNEADQQRAAAGALENAQPNIALPSQIQLDDMRQLDQELQIARARLNVGVSVTLLPKRALRVSVRRDGTYPTQHTADGSPLEASASHQIQLNVEDVAEITISGGAKDARDKFESLQTRWIAEAEPVLKRADVASVDALAQIARDVAQRSQAIQEARRAAAQLEQRVADQPDWAALLAGRRQEAAAAEETLEQVDRVKAEMLASEFGITDVAQAEHRLDLHNADRADLIAAEKRLDSELGTANARILDKQKVLAAVGEELVRARSSLQGEWQVLLRENLDRQTAVESDLKTIEAELEALSAEEGKPLTEALQALETAQQKVLSIEAEYRKVAEDLRVAENRQAASEGELKMRRELAAKLDEKDARDAVGQVESELNLVLEPDYEITDEMLTEAREQVQAARDELKSIEDHIQAKRGALQHVGGEVAKQRAEAAAEALGLAREREHELEIDYAAWELLRNTLREAEQEEGAHLGRALGDPIAKRFGELTSDRYGEIALGPNLETRGIAAAGSDRSVSSLSVGTRDQLSTIFRLSLAEQLQSTVILDDQLTQSDPQRMMWLRNLIRQVALNIQIVVFTCRPEDYLVPNETGVGGECGDGKPSVRKIDLIQIIDSDRAVPSG